MNRIAIRTFLYKDIRLVEVKRLLLFFLMVILAYYIYINFLLQVDADDNIYLVGLGYRSKEIVSSSLVGLFSTLFFLAGITSIDLNDKIFVGYSLIASRVRIINMVIARSIICIVCYLVSLVIITSYFTYQGYEVTELLMITTNAIIFTYTTYIILVYLFAQNKVQMLLAIISVVGVMYIPFLLSQIQFLILNMVYIVLSLFIILKFCENVYRNRLKEEYNNSINGLNVVGYVSYIINTYLEILSTKLYHLIAKLIPSSQTRYLSLLYVDIRRYVLLIKKLAMVIIIRFIFAGDSTMFYLISFVFYSSIIYLIISSYRNDNWLCRQGLLKGLSFTVYKVIVSFSFSVIYLLIFNLLNVDTSVIDRLLYVCMNSLILSILNILLYVFSRINKYDNMKL